MARTPWFTPGQAHANADAGSRQPGTHVPTTATADPHDRDVHAANVADHEHELLRSADAAPLATGSSWRGAGSPLWWSVQRRLAWAVALVALLWLVVAWAVI